MKKFRGPFLFVVALCMVLYMALPVSALAQQPVLGGADFSFQMCEQVVLPARVVLFNHAFNAGSAELLVQENDLELSTLVLSRAGGRNIIFVVDTYFNGRGIELPLQIAYNNEVTLQDTVRSVRSRRAGGIDDLERAVVSYTLPRSLWKQTFPEPGLYKITIGQEIPTNARVCQTAIEAWFLVGK